MNTIAISQPSPFLTIWTDARGTIRHILKTNPDYMVFPLAAATGVLPMLIYALDAGLVGPLALAVALVVAVVAGSSIGLVRLFFTSWLLDVTGEWIGGKATREDLQTAVAWSSVPQLAASALWVPLLLSLAPAGIAAVTGGDATAPLLLLLSIPLILAGVLGIALRLWSLVILCQGLGEVQGFGIWKVLLNIVLSWMLAVLVVALCAGVVFMLFYR